MPELKDSINLELWQKTQDNFAKEEQHPIATINLEGREAAVSGKFPFFCQLIKSKRPDLCEECRRNNLKNLGDSGKAAIFTCHAGLSYILAPFKLNNSRQGAILYEGFLESANSKLIESKCLEVSQKTGLETEELVDEIKKLSALNSNQVEMAKYLAGMIARTLPDLCYQDYKSKKELSELKVVQKITSMLNSTLDIDSILQSMVSFLVERLELENCSIILPGSSKRYAYSESRAEILKQAESVILKQITSSGNPSYILSLKEDFMMKQIPGIKNASYSVVSLPIIFRSKLLGMISLYSKENLGMDNEIVQLVKVVIDQAAVALVNAFHYKQTAESAVTDKLTELYNRRYFSESFRQEIERCQKEAKPISLIIFDLDDFKMLNDTAGHVEGDRVLKEIADITKKGIRSDDFACRYGGEEFVIVLPKTKPEEAKLVAEQIRKNVEEHNFRLKDYSRKVTISLGLITCMNSSANDSMMLCEADTALYKAKSRGKNRIASSIMIDRGLSVIDVEKAHETYVR